jgi:hypothetical protein
MVEYEFEKLIKYSSARIAVVCQLNLYLLKIQGVCLLAVAMFLSVYQI